METATTSISAAAKRKNIVVENDGGVEWEDASGSMESEDETEVVKVAEDLLIHSIDD